MKKWEHIYEPVKESEINESLEFWEKRGYELISVQKDGKDFHLFYKAPEQDHGPDVTD
jgi:hypothetical protein